MNQHQKSLSLLSDDGRTLAGHRYLDKIVLIKHGHVCLNSRVFLHNGILLNSLLHEAIKLSKIVHAVFLAILSALKAQIHAGLVSD